MNTVPEPPSFGFKTLTETNLLEPDLPIYTNGLTQKIWIEELLKVQLHPGVPTEVQGLFECCRSMLAYGWYFYPLCTLASEQGQRVLEAAAKSRCAQLALPAHQPSAKSKPRPFMFRDNVERLIRAGVIASADEEWWRIAAKRRNRASHVAFQSIHTAGTAVGDFQGTAERINELFPVSPTPQT